MLTCNLQFMAQSSFKGFGSWSDIPAGEKRLILIALLSVGYDSRGSSSKRIAGHHWEVNEKAVTGYIVGLGGTVLQTRKERPHKSHPAAKMYYSWGQYVPHGKENVLRTCDLLNVQLFLQMYPVRPVKSPLSTQTYERIRSRVQENTRTLKRPCFYSRIEKEKKPLILDMSSAQSCQKCKGALLKSVESAGRVVHEQNINCSQKSWWKTTLGQKAHWKSPPRFPDLTMTQNFRNGDNWHSMNFDWAALRIPTGSSRDDICSGTFQLSCFPAWEKPFPRAASPEPQMRKTIMCIINQPFAHSEVPL